MLQGKNICIPIMFIHGIHAVIALIYIGQFGLENPINFSKKPMKSQNFIGGPNEFLFS